MSLLLARATLIGLPKHATRALVFGCGSGHTTVALADHLGTALGVDPSRELVSCAELVHSSRANCEFAVGGIDELEVLPGRFDLVLADLSHRRVVSRRDAPRMVSALLSALTLGGIAAFGISARSGLRQRATSVRWSNVAQGIAAAGGRVTWTSEREGDLVWIFARGRTTNLRLLPAVQQLEFVPHSRV